MERKLYFVSANNMDGKKLVPKIPNNYFTKKGYEDKEIKRVRFYSSIDGCLMGMNKDSENKKLYVHVAEPCEYYIPNSKQVPECNITGEIWVLGDVKINCIGMIKLQCIKNKLGRRYTYNKGYKTRIYEWNWVWVIKDHIDNYNNFDIFEFKKKYPEGFYGVNTRSPESRKKTWNSAYYVGNKIYRERSEVLIINNKKELFIAPSSKRKVYNIPGGSLEPGIGIIETAIKETKEEAMINIKNVVHIGDEYLYNPSNYYIILYDDESIRIKYDGFYNHLCIAEYDSEFFGYINEADKNPLVLKGEFKPLEEVYDGLSNFHKLGLKKYFEMKDK